MLVADELITADVDGGIKIGDKLIEKCGKFSKIRKLSKSLKLSKSENSKSKKSAKPKKPSKSGNLPNFYAKKAGPSFLTPKAKTIFNYLWFVFTKAPILWHFDPEYHI